MEQPRAPRRVRRLGVAVLLLALSATATLGLSSSPSAARPVVEGVRPPAVLVGAGQADITPITGGNKGGWTCSCAKSHGQHTRLFARVIVLQQGRQKVALVAMDLAFLSAGMIRDAAGLLPGRGFSERNIITSATHTHGSQGGYMNFGSYNSVLPSVSTLTDFNLTDTDADPAMYSFMTRQLAKALRRADASLAPGAVGWGHAQLGGLTENRSLEAHLANHGINQAPGTGSVDQDPGGYRGTVDTNLDLLRVDRLVDGRSIPIGVFTTFANHGTVVRETFPYYSADHQGAAERVLADLIRRKAGLSPVSRVITAFANGDAGDMSSGLHRSGPAAAEAVGRREAGVMLQAWRAAGQNMSTHPKLDVRWTRLCLCGQDVAGRPSAGSAIIGKAAASGSEELRTAFYDLLLSREGDRLPVPLGPHGHKIPLLPLAGSVPSAVPLTTLRIDDQLMVTWPGEATIGVGSAVRQNVLAATRNAGIRRVVFTGYSGEYLSYWTTPKEYGRQHYEGGFTMYGPYASWLVRDAIVDNSTRLVSGRPAAAPYDYDPNHGVHVTDDGYGPGAANGTVTSQPVPTRRLDHPAFSWTGGPFGIDRPVDRSFVTVQRRVSGSWRRVTDDLGLQIVWDVDRAGAYTARWEVPLSAPVGAYRFVVTAKRYVLRSATFRVSPGRMLVPRVVGGQVVLSYPAATPDADWTYRPARATRGAIAFLVDGRRVTVRSSSGRFDIPSGHSISIPAGDARDRHGNANPRAVSLR